MTIFQGLKRFTTFGIMLLIGGCVKLPEGVEPVTNFDINKYLGTWYEIARLDHSFERGLERVTAEYSLREDGGIKVINRGYNTAEKTWKEALGRAYFVDAHDVGRLKVSFFGPFYGGYNIIALDKENYLYSLVCGPSKEYLWILARTPALDTDILERLVSKAETLDFTTENLIYVIQGQE